MYQRRRQSPILFFVIITLGVVVGLVFVLSDNGAAPIAPLAPTSVLPVAPEMIANLPTATALFQALDLPMPRADVELVVPAAGISAPIIQVFLDGSSWNVSQLGLNAGHLQGTAWLEAPGNIALAGHVEMRDGRQGIFANLRNLQTGDTAILTMEGVERRYEIREIRHVAPDDLSVLYPTQGERLTLITCDQFDFLQNVYRERIVAIAERVA